MVTPSVEASQGPLFSELPTKRAAYSDRMSVLMAEMSRLAYIPFERPDEAELNEVVERVRNAPDAEAAKAILERFTKGFRDEQTGSRERLITRLTALQFELVSTYAVGETQAFLAKQAYRNTEDRTSTGVLVLSFRGTESRRIKDWLTDLDARKTNSRGVGVHTGFWSAFGLVKAQIQEDIAPLIGEGYTLYITGYSLGGALALITTRELGNDSTGACYTFGQPRVSEYGFARDIKTPIYRMVNASDVVPRMPPMVIHRLLTFVLSIPIIVFPGKSWVLRILKQFFYVHHGDMRYLTKSRTGKAGDYSDVSVLLNPNIVDRAKWLLRDILPQFGSLVGDHAIADYYEKLRAYAIKRDPSLGSDD